MTLALTLGITWPNVVALSGRTSSEKKCRPTDIADLTRPFGGTLAPAPPPVTHRAALVADARCHPETTAVGACRERRGGRLQDVAKPPFFEALLRFGVPSRVARARLLPGTQSHPPANPGHRSRGGRSWRSAPPASGIRSARVQAQTPSRSGFGPAMMTAASAASSSKVLSWPLPRRVALWTVVKPLRIPLHCNEQPSVAEAFGDRICPQAARHQPGASPPASHSRYP